MSVSISLYNHTPKLFANKEIDLTNLKVELLSNSASLTRTHTSKESVDNGSKSTVTISIASPGVVTWNSHGFSNGQPIALLITGALPTGLTAGTVYYVVSAATNTFQLAATVGGSAINTSGSQSGTHTAYASGSYEVYGNGWTAFGPTLANVAVAAAAISGATANDAKLSADNVVVTAAGGSIGSAYKALLYDATIMKPLAFIDFGQAQAAGDTTDFKIRWNANGIINWNNTDPD